MGLQKIELGFEGFIVSDWYAQHAGVASVNAVAAADVAQLYLDIPGSGVPKVLGGFEKQSIEPGASVTMTSSLKRKDMSIWDVVKQQWTLPSGAFNIMIGKSVLDIQSQATLTI